MDENKEKLATPPVPDPVPNQPVATPDPAPKKADPKIPKILIMIVGIIILIIILFFGFNAFIRKQELTSPSKRLLKNNSSTISPTPIPGSSKNLLPVPTDFPSAPVQGKFAYIDHDNVWINNNGKVKQITTDAIHTSIPYWTGLPKIFYSSPEISPDGNSVAFLKNMSSTDGYSLYMADTNGSNIQKLTDNDVDWLNKRLQWSKDSKIIYYISSKYSTSNGSETVEIHDFSIATKKINKVGTFLVTKTGCGGGSDDISDHLAEEEGYKGKTIGSDFFSLSSDNNYIAHPVNCFSSGVGLLNLTTHSDQLLNSGDGGSATFSPSGKMIALTNNGNVIILETTTGKTTTTLTPSGMPLNLLWAPDEKSIYYVSIKLEGVPHTVKSDILNNTAIFTSTISNITLENKDKKIADFNAHYIKLINITPDNSSIKFSLIENSINLFNHMQQTHDGTSNIVNFYPRVKVTQINLTNGVSKTLIENAQQASYLPL